MTRPRLLYLSLWLLLLALSAVVVARARYSADLSAFLPRSPSATQQLLVQQLQDGLASRLILMGIEGADAVDQRRELRIVGQPQHALTLPDMHRHDAVIEHYRLRPRQRSALLQMIRGVVDQQPRGLERLLEHRQVFFFAEIRLTMPPLRHQAHQLIERGASVAAGALGSRRCSRRGGAGGGRQQQAQRQQLRFHPRGGCGAPPREPAAALRQKSKKLNQL